MKKIVLGIAILTMFCLVSCKENSKEGNGVNTSTEQKQEILEKENSITGTYRANIPGANSVIEVELVLNEDKSFTMCSIYIDKSDEKFEDKGTYSVKDGLIMLDLNKNEFPTQLKIEDEYLLQLDAEGKEITGALAEHYKYKKQ